MFSLDPEITFLNHGSFGATPISVQAEQRRLQAELEREPVDFLVRKLPELLERARQSAAALVGAAPANLAFTPNATTGINAVLNSVQLRPDDEILTTNHRYDAVRNTLERRAQQTGARVVEAELPFPETTVSEILDAIATHRTARTRLLVIDAITSPTAMALPIKDIISHFKSPELRVLVDGAHAPGHIPVDLATLGADWWVGNLHKWICAPKGAALVWCADEHLASLENPVTSHGWRNGLHAEFDWTGTHDPSARLCASSAIAWWRSHGGEALSQRHVALATSARAAVAASSRLQLPPPLSPELRCAMHTIPLDGVPVARAEELFHTLFREWQIEVPVFAWRDQTWLRYSAFALYNTLPQYQRLGEALHAVLPRFR